MLQDLEQNDQVERARFETRGRDVVFDELDGSGHISDHRSGPLAHGRKSRLLVADQPIGGIAWTLGDVVPARSEATTDVPGRFASWKAAAPS